ncbi:hypothetical protein ACFLZZ_04460 [Nanoarchaeota archaeon]
MYKRHKDKNRKHYKTISSIVRPDGTKHFKYIRELGIVAEKEDSRGMYELQRFNIELIPIWTNNQKIDIPVLTNLDEVVDSPFYEDEKLSQGLSRYLGMLIKNPRLRE